MRLKIIFLLLIALTFLLIKEKYPKRLFDYFFPTEKEKINFTSNNNYHIYNDIYGAYNKREPILMLGDSFISGIQWNELLNQSNIISRGIPGDQCNGILHRLPSIMALSPIICVLMVGSNDLSLGYLPQETTDKLMLIAQTLSKHNITPIIYSILYAGDGYYRKDLFNHKVDLTNQLIKERCELYNISYIDLNTLLKDNNQLHQKYTYDGTHLNMEGYLIWKNTLNEVLKNYQYLLNN